MKTTIVVMLCSLSVNIASAKKLASSAVPASVKHSFESAFKNVTGTKWELERGDYEVSFLQQGHKMSVLYDAAGNLKETEQEMPVAKLPQPAIAYVREHYAHSKILDAATLTFPDGRTNYEAHIKGMDVIFDGNGVFLKTQKD